MLIILIIASFVMITYIVSDNYTEKMYLYTAGESNLGLYTIKILLGYIFCINIFFFKLSYI